MLIPASLISAVRAALAIEFKVPIDLREIKNLPPSILLTMVVVGVALGLAWLYARK